MKIDVYDTYATLSTGKMVHFDVFIPSGENKATAVNFANAFLATLEEKHSNLNQQLCNFCHSEITNPRIAAEIAEHGHFILQMEGCPNPYGGPK
ncbi:DUF2024 family protein [Aliamphritea spongicola]|uniref:DUF2024 family protein n=1 Tax=Aliamphritea spongicola TaxID=707589 RepID=UPI00196A9CC5|nr:DUF2024 family protein [Aliamphritea spongicola]MBN3560803.1 DUF2024 family protein [Aliamphritea spongicola]